MPSPRFIPLTLAEFQELVARYPVQRRITAVHMHHTWRPRQRDYAGHATILSMWRYHTQEKGWSDIAQHATIAPDGTIWTGRSWDLPPASSVGHNGNALAGPFMFEIIGDFDAGQDKLEGKQREAVIGVIVAIQRGHGLGPEALRFHRDLGSPKTCPGKALAFEAFIEACRAAHAASTRRAAARGRRAPARKHVKESPFGASKEVVRSAMLAMRERARIGITSEAAEDDHAEGRRAVRVPERARRHGPRSRSARAPAPVVVNLTQGVFPSSGILPTSRGDVDALFDGHLAQALDQAKRDGHPLRLVVLAHGGLVDDATELALGPVRLLAVDQRQHRRALDASEWSDVTGKRLGDVREIVAVKVRDDLPRHHLLRQQQTVAQAQAPQAWKQVGPAARVGLDQEIGTDHLAPPSGGSTGRRLDRRVASLGRNRHRCRSGLEMRLQRPPGRQQGPLAPAARRRRARHVLDGRFPRGRRV